MSNTHEPPQHNTEEATNNINATTLLENIYVNIDAGLTFDAVSIVSFMIRRYEIIENPIFLCTSRPCPPAKYLNVL